MIVQNLKGRVPGRGLSYLANPFFGNSFA